MKKLVCCCLLAIVSLALDAQEIVIKGKVKDAGNSEPVVAANVSLLTADSVLVGGMATDTKGSFRLHNIQVGDYLVSVTYLTPPAVSTIAYRKVMSIPIPSQMRIIC